MSYEILFSSSFLLFLDNFFFSSMNALITRKILFPDSSTHSTQMSFHAFECILIYIQFKCRERYTQHQCDNEYGSASIKNKCSRVSNFTFFSSLFLCFSSCRVWKSFWCEIFAIKMNELDTFAPCENRFFTYLISHNGH